MSLEHPVIAHDITGRCLCGAVTVKVGRHRAEVGACHCSRCRRWTGSALFCFEAYELSYEGPVRTWAHEIAERAFCGECGTLLWLKDFDGPWEPQVGLFDAAKDYPLISEVYADCAFSAVDLAGDHVRRTAEEYEVKARHVEAAP